MYIFYHWYKSSHDLHTCNNASFRNSFYRWWQPYSQPMGDFFHTGDCGHLRRFQFSISLQCYKWSPGRNTPPHLPCQHPRCADQPSKLNISNCLQIVFKLNTILLPRYHTIWWDNPWDPSQKHTKKLYKTLQTFHTLPKDDQDKNWVHFLEAALPTFGGGDTECLGSGVSIKLPAVRTWKWKYIHERVSLHFRICREYCKSKLVGWNKVLDC